MSCPRARQASRMVAPSGTRTASPSISSSRLRRMVTEIVLIRTSFRAVAAWSCARLLEDAQLADGRVDGVRRSLAEPADRCVAHHLRDLAEQRDLVCGRATRPLRRKP